MHENNEKWNQIILYPSDPQNTSGFSRLDILYSHLTFASLTKDKKNMDNGMKTVRK